MIETVRSLALGRYLAGDSVLHGCDPRIKLLLLPLLMMAIFTSGTLRLALLALALLALIKLAGFSFRRCWSMFYALRWLLLFTLLLHLLFSPGRTLFGTSWLSYDGLLFGLLICARLAVALLYASLLTQTTPPGEIAAALAWLLKPLVLIGINPEKIAEFLFLTLSFFPILEEEAGSLARRFAFDLTHGNVLQRSQAAGRLIEPLALTLFDRADLLAHQATRGEPIAPRVELGPLGKSAFDKGCCAVPAAALLLLWMI